VHSQIDLEEISKRCKSSERVFNICEFWSEKLQKEEEEELRVKRPGVNEVSFRARPHHNVHRTLGVNTGATGSL
jgi:hypothetical protein